MSYFNKDFADQLKERKFFVYLRRSSEDSEDRQIASIPRQLHEVEEEIINRYGLNVIKPFYEESRSAFKEGRPDFNDILQKAKAGEGDGVITWHANRLARNYGDGGKFVQTLSDGDIKIVLTCSGHFENTPRDLEYLMTEFTRAARDSGDKSEAVKSGNREKFFEEKWWLGPAKPGYLNVTDPITKEKYIKKDAERFPIIKKAIKLILEGFHTPMQALYKLNNKFGYRSRRTVRQGGKLMAKSGWYRLLSDPYYYGLMVRKEGEVMGKHEPMLLEEEFKKLQIILGSKGKSHYTKHEFPFKPVLKCTCGGAVTAEEKWQIICLNCKTKFHKAKGRDTCPECKILIEEMKSPKILHYVYLRCAKKVNPECTEKAVEIKEFEKQIDEELSKYEIPELFKEWAIKHLNEVNDAETQDRETIRLNLENGKTDKIKELDNLVKLKISPQNSDGSVLSDSEYDTQRKTILVELESFDRQLKGVDKERNKYHELSIKTFNFACYARHWFANGSVQDKTEILGTLGSNLILKDKKLLIQGQNPFFLIEKGKKEALEVAQKFEPSINAITWGNIFALEPVRSSWLGDRDLNPDK